MEPRESVLAGVGEIRHVRRNTPEQSQDLREDVVGCLISMPGTASPRKTLKPRATNGKRGSRNPIGAIRGGAKL
jgi:hypothetical protein